MNLNSLIPLIPLLLKGNFIENLKNLDEDTLLPIASILGLSNDAAKGLIKIIPPLISGNLTISEIIPALLPVALEFFSNEKSEETPQNFDDSTQIFVNLSPLENLADERIYSALNISLSEDNT